MMYTGYAVSMKSKKDGYIKAQGTIAKYRTDPESIRLDRYYFEQRILDDFSENTRTFIIMKKNSRVRVSMRRRKIIRSFMNDPIACLKEYFH